MTLLDNPEVDDIRIRVGRLDCLPTRRAMLRRGYRDINRSPRGPHTASLRVADHPPSNRFRRGSQTSKKPKGGDPTSPNHSSPPSGSPPDGGTIHRRQDKQNLALTGKNNCRRPARVIDVDHADGKVLLKMRRAWHDGTRAILFEPHVFIE